MIEHIFNAIAAMVGFALFGYWAVNHPRSLIAVLILIVLALICRAVQRSTAWRRMELRAYQEQLAEERRRERP